MKLNNDGGEVSSRRRRAVNSASRDEAAEADEAVSKMIGELRAELERERAKTQAILLSTSWKLTAPVRLAKSLVSALRWPKKKRESNDTVAFAPNKTEDGSYRPLNTRSKRPPSTVIEQVECSEFLFSILVPVSMLCEVERLATTLASLQAQDHGGWQLIVVPFARGDRLIPATAFLRLRKVERRIHFGKTAQSRGAALNCAVALATGTFVLPLQAGDVLPPSALTRLASRFMNDPELDILYADEDSLRDGLPCKPQLKPSWSPELLLAYDYFGRPTAMRREAVQAAGAYADDLGAACEWDLHLRLAGPDMDRARTSRIDRITEILCHRACDNAGRAAPAEAASDDFRRALTRHWGRQGLMAKVVTRPDGTQHASWAPRHAPRVSAIVLNKDHAALLRNCLDGLLARTSYPLSEIIVVDNGSTDYDTLKLYREAEAAGVRIVRFDEVFNYSRACNLGAAAATGDFLLFLNNDLEMIEPDWLHEMVRKAGRPGVGIVGARLIYPTGRLQHGGVVLGLRELCSHPYTNKPAPDQDTWGPAGSPSVCRNYMAVTGACVLISRTVFDRVGGFDECFMLAFGDVKLGIDAWRAGYRNVYAPQAVLVHHEGSTRGTETPHADQVALARSIAAAGIEDDPYFHPAIGAHASEPALRHEHQPSSGDVLQACVARLHPTKPMRSLDLFDDAAVMVAVERPWHELFWLPVLPHEVADRQSAARLIIDLLRQRPDLRAAFPRALSDGGDGAFAAWLKSEGGLRIGLSQEAAPWIDAAYDAGFASRPRQRLIDDGKLRLGEPMFLLPTGRAASARVLFTAVADEVLEPIEVWWMLLSSAEVPERELALTWQLTPDWQRAHPAGLTMFGCDGLSAWIRRSFNIDEDWLDPGNWPISITPAEQIRMAYLGNEDWRASFPNCYADRAAFGDFFMFLTSDKARLTLRARQWVEVLDPDTLLSWVDINGVNVFGHFCYPSGLQTSVNAIVNSLHKADISTSLRDVRVPFGTDLPGHERYVGSALFDTTLIHIQPEPLFDQYLTLSDLAERMPPPYRIGYWYWEFDTIPSTWDDAALQCQELWTATRFVAEGLSARYSLPVRVVPPGLELPDFRRYPRHHFGLSDRSYIFNFTFHLESVMERKNPLALVAAFRLAFSGTKDAQLIIKVTGSEQHPHSMATLRAAADGLNVRIIDATFSRAETLSLMATADAYVSLHRSEGFGLTLAEAMLLGKPTIATGYSGNLDFMHNKNSLLICHRLVELDRDEPPYPAGLRWAEPDVEHAAEMMLRLYRDRDYGREIGLIAQTEVSARFSLHQAGREMADLLRGIRRGQQRKRSPTIIPKNISFSLSEGGEST